MIEFGITPREFRSASFEKEPRLFRSALSERPFAWSDLDTLLHVVPPGAPAMRLFHHGVVPESEFVEQSAARGQTRPKLDKLKFYSLMGKGATLVMNRLEDFSVDAKRLCVEIGRFAGAHSSSNAYVSFSGDGTFGKHWDTHDVFAIQLIGRKQWRIFPPTLPLPLTYQTNERSGHACPAEPALEVMLEEGDILYLPRGWWHHVVPRNEGSFHLSVGIYSPTLYDYVLATSAKYLQQRAYLRRAFSADDYREGLAEALRELPAFLLDPSNAAAFEQDAIEREPLDSEFNVELFLDPINSPLTGEFSVSLTTFSTPGLERGDMAVNGSRLMLDPGGQAVVTALRDCGWIGFDALCERLPALSRDSVHRAVLNLARHDIVTIRDDRDAADLG